jgi:L-threonylcarbamoyladenylate synthase
MDTNKIVKVIKNGGIGIIPTDTLYGVIGSALNKKAVLNIYKLKERDNHKPFIVLISSINDLKKFNINLSYIQKVFLNKNWPNPLSIILPVLDKKFNYLHRGNFSIAFRLPKQESLIKFIKKVGPIVAPSANIQGENPISTIKEAKEVFKNNVDFYISNGKKVSSIFPSTIVSLLKEKPEVIRQGKFKINKK